MTYVVASCGLQETFHKVNGYSCHPVRQNDHLSLAGKLQLLHSAWVHTFRGVQASNSHISFAGQ